ncbi:ABC transporter ATP-binding protein [Fodinicola feengrottensis]
MYGGRLVEQAPAAELFTDPRHPYTVGLLASVPRTTDRPRPHRLTSIDPGFAAGARKTADRMCVRDPVRPGFRPLSYRSSRAGARTGCRSPKRVPAAWRGGELRCPMRR